MPRGDDTDLTTELPAGFTAGLAAVLDQHEDEEFTPVFELPEPTDPMMMSEPSVIMEPEYEYVTTQKHLREVVKKLKKADRIGFDIETASTYISYAVQHGSIRLIQLSLQNPDGSREDFVIDQWDVDVKPLFPIFEDPNIRKIIHNAQYEQRWSTFMHNVDIQNQFCTMRALGPIITARRQFADQMRTKMEEMGGVNPLGPPLHADKTRLEILREFGIGEVIAEDFRRDPDGFGLPHVFRPNQCSMKNAGKYWFATDVDKTEQSSLWSRRPLTESQKTYAAIDSRILIQMEDWILHEAAFWNVANAVSEKGTCWKIEYDKESKKKRWMSHYERTKQSIDTAQEEKESLDYDASYRVIGLLRRARTVKELDKFHAKSRQVSLFYEQREHADKFYRRRRQELKNAEARHKKPTSPSVRKSSATAKRTRAKAQSKKGDS